MLILSCVLFIIFINIRSNIVCVLVLYYPYQLLTLQRLTLLVSYLRHLSPHTAYQHPYTVSCTTLLPPYLKPLYLQLCTLKTGS
jgi:hypothetical protein